MAAQIADYEASDDDYFRARAADLRDLRDEVVRRLSGRGRHRPPGRRGAHRRGRDADPLPLRRLEPRRRHRPLRRQPVEPCRDARPLARRADDRRPRRRSTSPATTTAIVDAYSGRVILSPRDEHWSEYETARTEEAGRAGHEAEAALRPARTRDGVPVAVMINVAEPEELDALDPAICDGIGLVRTEFLFHKAGIPDEETQYRAYRRILEWAAPKPVVLRTLDAGGDKPIPGLTIDGESNPFLGTRGIRLCLARPDIFRIQLRAMARAAAHGNAKIMLPMVTVPAEIDQAAALLDDVVAELAAAGIAHARPPLGIMVEVPAVAVVPELFARAAFFSIGSNDLTQYVTAAARDIAAVSALVDAGSSGRASRLSPRCRRRSAARNRRESLRRHGRRPATYPRPPRRRAALGLRRAAAGRPGEARHRRRGLAVMDDRPEVESDEAVARYKSILQRVMENRPSGTRQRLAGALGKNRSFVSQITNPAYATPIPARHIETIFDICHFSPDERRAFLDAYAAAHPRRTPPAKGHRGVRPHTIYLPDLGDEEKNNELARMVGDYVQRLTRLVDPNR